MYRPKYPGSSNSPPSRRTQAPQLECEVAISPFSGVLLRRPSNFLGAFRGRRLGQKSRSDRPSRVVRAPLDLGRRHTRGPFVDRRGFLLSSRKSIGLRPLIWLRSPGFVSPGGDSALLLPFCLPSSKSSPGLQRRDWSLILEPRQYRGSGFPLACGNLYAGASSHPAGLGSLAPLLS